LCARLLLAGDRDRDVAHLRLYRWATARVTAAIDAAYPQVLRLGAGDGDFGSGDFGSGDFGSEGFGSEDEALEWLDRELPTLLAVVQGAGEAGDPSLAWRIADQLRGYFLIRLDADGWLPSAETGLAAAAAAGDDRVRVAMLINRAQAFGAVGRDEDALSDCLAAQALAIGVGWTQAAAYGAHQLGWLQFIRGRLGDAELWMLRAMELTEDDRRGHIRAIVVNGLGMIRLHQGEPAEAAELFGSALRLIETGRQTSALVIRGNLASAVRQLGHVDRAEELLDELLESYRRRSHLRGELSTLDELARLYSRRGDGTTALRTALRAHQLALAVRDRKAQAQTASAVAEAHLALGDPAAAIHWIEECLAIARSTYPYLEAEALLILAAARDRTGAATAAADAAAQAAAIAAPCGFRLLEATARDGSYLQA
jgi:tetratricopeptide (TPR) repeat protein